VPATPVAPTTTWIPDDVLIEWVASDYGGSAITGYRVSIQKSDGDFQTDNVNCDMTSSVSTSCIVQVIALRNSPFNLNWGDSVYAKVIAINDYGDSLESE
jgi:hypothetical protein